MSIDKLEQARDLLEESPAKALKELPSAASLPAALRAERHYLAAEAWRAMGYFERAETFYGKVLTKSTAREDAPLWIEAALGSAAGLRSIGVVAAAYRRVRGAEKLARLENLPNNKKQFALERALIERAAGRYLPSLKMLRPMLASALRDKSFAEAAFLLWAIGGAERFSGDLAASEASFLRSKKLAAQARDRVGEGYALFGLGGVTRIRGRLEDSARCYAAAARLFHASDDHFARAYAYCGYGNALRQLGRLRQAEIHYRKSHRLYSQLGDAVDLAYVDWGLGEVNLRRGKLREAAGFYRKSLAAFRKHAETRGEVLAGTALARCLHAQGSTAEAERLFAQSYRLSRRAGIHAHIESFT
ncbi:MAG: tetratricopeptide repeat protein [Elusimicrobiota bacterium]